MSETESEQAHRPSVKVYGCSVDVFNGTYPISGAGIRSTPTYKMEGQWEGKPVTFIIALVSKTREKYQWSWRLYISMDGKEMKDWLHFSSNLSNDTSGPPLRGWWPTKRNLRPPIVIQDDQAPVDWRQDPLESLSDCKVSIVSEFNDVLIETTYHVHKMVLASGSSYFSGIFRRHGSEGYDFAEKQSQSSRIQLTNELAEVFPCFLDYLYGRFSNPATLGTILPATYDDDVIIYLLADYFGASYLVKDLDALILNGSKEGIKHYLEVTARLKMAVAVLVDVCVKRLPELDTNSLKWLASEMDMTQLQRLLSEPEASEGAHQKRSGLVAHFCVQHEVDLETFTSLTTESLLPHIGKEAVWMLLDRERALLGATKIGLSNLEVRCIDVLATHFDDLQHGNEDPLHAQSMEFLYQLMVKSKSKRHRAR